MYQINIFAFINTLLDLNDIEETELPHCTVGTIGNSGKITLLQSESRIQQKHFQTLLEVGLNGCSGIRDLIDEHVRRQGKITMAKINR